MESSTAAGTVVDALGSVSEQPFPTHQVSIGDWVAVYFDLGLFFGVVVEIKVLTKSGKN
jgi:hypothetical protein